MTYQKLLGISLSLCFCVTSLLAQDKNSLLNEPDHNRPKLFSDLPSSVAVSTAELEELLTPSRITAGKEINFRFPDHKLKSFSGKIVSSSERDLGKLHSVVIRSSNYNGATLTLTATTAANGIVEYTGRIISFKSGDAFELKKDNDQYTFIKKDFYHLVSE